MNILMFAHHSSQNRGCEAIVRSTNSLIKQKIAGAKTFLISEKPETDQMHIDLDAIYNGEKKTIAKFSYPWFISYLRMKLLNDESYALSKIEENTIKHIKDMDICLSIGGDNYCYGEQPGWYEIDRKIKQQGRKLVLWGCSIGEEDLSEKKLEDLKNFDLILARESITYETLKRYGLNQVKLCADPAFTMEKEELPLLEGWQEKNTIGVNFSPLIIKRNPQSQIAVRRLIEHILQTTSMTIALTPHVIQENNDDFILLKELYQEFKSSNRVLLIPNDLNAIQYKGYISRMRFFIGARTHATIAAYSTNVPTLVLGYSVKSRGIAKDLFGEERFVLGVDELSDINKLLKQFDLLYKEEDDIKKQLESRIPEMKQLSTVSVDYLMELAGGGEG
ncbi:hypothetical protein BTS2_3900 [Bacillus sp. TS-2]|nr:hypothetical protein BTS2_3900 [Bacillus sp. TS-2]